jgi:hypothetical protein
MRTTAAAVVTTTFRSDRRRPALFLVLGLFALLPACSSCGGKEAGPDGAAVVELSEVPEPEGLAAELVVGKPGETWSKLRDLGGGPARLLPQSFGLLVSTFLGLPATAADSIDPDLPVTGAACTDEKGELSAVTAIHVRNGKELVARLSAGGDAHYSARADATSGFTLLDPKPGKASEEVALGVLGNYLVAARHGTDITKVGPYAVRTLTKREPPKTPLLVTLRKRALSGPLSAEIVALWKAKKSELERQDQQNREKHGGRAPDFGDPAAAIGGIDAAVEGFTRALGSASGARLLATPLADRLELRTEVDAEKTGELADLISSMVVGDARPLLAMPTGTAVGVLTRTTAATRAASAKSMAEGIAGLFADRLPSGDRDKLQHALSDLAAGRGDWESYGLLLSGGRGGLVYRAGLSDPKSFAAGAKALFGSLGLKAFSEPLRQFVGDVSVKQSTANVPGISGNVQRAVIVVKPSGIRAQLDKSGKAGAESQTVEALWWLDSDKAYGALSFDAVPLLGKLVQSGSDPKATQASDARVSAALARVKDASFVVLVEPLALDTRQSASLAPNSPVVTSFGKSGKSAYVAVDADKVALESLLKAFALSR